MRTSRRYFFRAAGGLAMAGAVRLFAAPLVWAQTSGPAPIDATSAPDFDVPGGHFYTQADGQGGGTGTGYVVSNADGMPFWDVFRRAGGVGAVGYPVSHRFRWDGFVVQAFQRVVFQWRPEVGAVVRVNILDEMHRRGLDAYLVTAHQTPPPADWSADQLASWDQVVQRHLAVLQGHPDFAAAYFAHADWLDRNGLPMAPIADMGAVVALCCQRQVFHRWKVAVPGAPAGVVVGVNVGDVGKAAGLYPNAAITPQPASTAPISVISAPVDEQPAVGYTNDPGAVVHDFLQAYHDDPRGQSSYRYLSYGLQAQIDEHTPLSAMLGIQENYTVSAVGDVQVSGATARVHARLIGSGGAVDRIFSLGQEAGIWKIDTVGPA